MKDFNLEIELEKHIQKNNEMRNDIFRKMFGQFMKPNTLIRIKEEIKKSYEFNEIILNCYSFQPNPIVALGADDVDFDICANLAMNFWYENLLETNETKKKKLQDSKYIEELKSKVILQCKLRQIEQIYGKSNSFLSYTPLNYSINCVANYLLSNIENNLKNKIRPVEKNGNFKINTLIVLLKNIKSILLLIETNNCGSAFSLLRSVIEMTCTYYTIGESEKVANEYYKFMQFRATFEYEGECPQEFYEIIPKNANLQNYLNYGWLDSLQNKQYKYVFSDLLQYTQISNKDLKNNFIDAYKYCCKFSHGNYLNQSIGPYDFIWILGRVGFILLELAHEYEKLFNDKIVVNEIELVKWLNQTAKESFKIYNKQVPKNS